MLRTPGRPPRLGQSREEEGDEDVDYKGSAVQLLCEAFTKVAARSEPKETGVGITSLGSFRELITWAYGPAGKCTGRRSVSQRGIRGT